MSGSLAIRDTPRWITDPRLRELQFEDPAWLIQDELPVGYTVLMGAPKTGKTALLLPMAQRLAAAGYRVAYLALDDTPRRMRSRSIMSDPEGAYPLLSYCFWAPANRAEAFGQLAEWLSRAEEQQRPIDVIFIDTYGVFVGARQDRGNVFSEDYQTGQYFKSICARFGTSVIVSHHTRKGAESDDFLDMMNGSAGMAAAADAIMYIKRSRGVRDGILKITSNDGDDVIRPIILGDNMVWGPAHHISVAQASHSGCPRAILDYLAQEASTATLIELTADTGENRNSIRRALQDLKSEGLVDNRGPTWTLTGHPHNKPAVPGAVVPKGAAEGRAICEVCQTGMVVLYQGQKRHPMCGGALPPERPAPATSPPAPPEPATQPAPKQEDPEPDPQQINGFRMLQDSINASRMKPLPRIPAAERGQPPWTLITEMMTGEHRWYIQAPPHAHVGILDRNGSYPSAMGSVPLAANRLIHTGPLPQLVKGIAGIFLINQIEWDEPFAHPLGKLACQDGPIWVSTPHLLLLQRLFHAGRIPTCQILDSWTGKATGGLFTAFSKSVAQARDDARGDQEWYESVKRSTSIAIRCLWPKAAKSPFWRPDWSISVRAEAAVRHWIRAEQCWQAGNRVVGLGAVDEVAIAVDGPVPDWTTWCPEPYKLGTRYGQVKLKSVTDAAAWNTSHGDR